MESSSLREDRWQPVRGGLINLFKYEDQVFRYENGRLLLRGDNGSGKSRVLALQLPFLLDGEISPYRVEPDRDPAKRMEWHLLMDRHERRTGYTWIEFGCRENGEARYLTLGCGMDARKGGGAPDRWFFITPRRIGHDLQLLRNRVPLGRRQLAAEFVEPGSGALYERVGEYRSAVDDALFKLGPRYLPLIDLLIQLRQPQLMRDMKEDVLSDALSEALPPVPDQLINEVAESFQGLDSDRQRTEEHRAMLDSVESFRDGYRQYLSVAIRRLCEDVRSGHSQFEHAARDLRKIDEQIDENARTLTTVREQAEANHTQLARVEAEITALRESPEMRSKRHLDQARQRAEEGEREAESARLEWDRATEALTTAIADREQRAGKCSRLEESLTIAHRDLATKHEAVAPRGTCFVELQDADLAKARAEGETLIANRRRSIAHLRRRNEEIARRQKQFELSRERVEIHRANVAESEEKLSASQSKLRSESDAFGRAAASWEASLEALHPNAFPRGSDWSAQLSEWLEAGDGDSPFTRQLHEGREQVRGEIATARAGIAAEARAVEADRNNLLEELQPLREGRQPEPHARPTRSPRPADRPGAPFWRCFDFREDIPEQEHPGWEAALESSGILDAWVFPDGTLQATTGDDDFLILGGDRELNPADSLAAVLRVVDGAETLTGILQRIGNHQGAARCWVDREGEWANGPHLGRYTKLAAEFLGHRAREAARARRIAELESSLEALETQLHALSARDSEQEAQSTRLETEVHSAPPIAPLTELAHAIDNTRQALQEHQTRLAEAELQAASARESLDQGIADRDTDAADMSLSDWAEPAKLDEFADALTLFDKAAIAFWPVWENFIEARNELQLAIEREANATENEERRRKQHAERRDEAARRRTEADTLFATIGKTVQDLMNRLREAETGKAATERERDALHKSVGETEILAARLEEKQIAAQEKRESAEATRNHGVERMSTFAAERLIGEIDPSAQPGREELSATAAVDLARRLEQQLKAHPHDEEHWNRLQSEIAGSFNELSDQLGRHGLLPRLRVIDESSVSVITCDYQGQRRTVQELSGVLRESLANRERIFEEQERKVIENHLIGEAAVELLERIRDGEDWVANVNRQLSQVTTSSGIQLKFYWDVADAADEQLKAVRKLFLKATATWTLAERDAVGRFLQDRIRAVREADDTLTWREHLRLALDYRGWHRFGILLRRPGDDTWKKLTKRSFGTGSGGEKAMTLTVPQFAAAAAHYQSADPRAPRLILLDEVFVAIDAPTRSRLMELLETFDLDYVMTSEREWGVYPTVSSLAIYQLASRPGYDAVAVTRWVWNGRNKVRDEQRVEETSTTPDSPDG